LDYYNFVEAAVVAVVVVNFCGFCGVMLEHIISFKASDCTSVLSEICTVW